ncbi:hypothetical protein IHE44_0002619, partial [Lamprotornis superbus]
MPSCWCCTQWLAAPPCQPQTHPHGPWPWAPTGTCQVAFSLRGFLMMKMTSTRAGICGLSGTQTPRSQLGFSLPPSRARGPPLPAARRAHAPPRWATRGRRGHGPSPRASWPLPWPWPAHLRAAPTHPPRAHRATPPGRPRCPPVSSQGHPSPMTCSARPSSTPCRPQGSPAS